MLTNKALWTIERHLERLLTLGDLADACGVSQFHLAHAFGEATGLSVMQYVRGRRLTEAAQSLTSGNAPDILNLALDAGYGSHEAFSRAFRAQFGATPEMVRKSKTVENLAMIRPMKVPERTGFTLESPRFVSSPAMLVAGLAERHSFGATQGIPGQWQRFMKHYAEIPHKVQPIPLGVSPYSGATLRRVPALRSRLHARRDLFGNLERLASGSQPQGCRRSKPRTSS
jgi:AraC family transcriptional regulator